MNTRVHPRSVVQAFPKTCAYACALERPRQTDYPVLWWLCLIVLGVAGAIAVFTN